MAEQRVPAVQTAPSLAVYARAVVRGWRKVFDGEIPLEPSIAVLYAQYMVETGGVHCYNNNIGNVKKVDGDGFDYHCLVGTWEGVSPAVAQQLVATGQAVYDTNEGHKKAVGPNRVSVVFQPPHPATRFRAFPSLDDAMVEHLKLLSKRFYLAWPFVLVGDYVEFAKALGKQHYFTADPMVYANLMKGFYYNFIKATGYEDAVAEMLDEEKAKKAAEETVVDFSIVHAMPEFAPLKYSWDEDSG